MVGELSNLKAATLPVIAAVGGMVVPAVIALAIGWGTPGIEKAWAIPVATDIAFALGVLALTASGLPSSLRVFLLSLAVVDDLGAIVIIAVLFTATFNLLAAAAAAALLALYWFLQHKRVTHRRCCTCRSRVGDLVVRARGGRPRHDRRGRAGAADPGAARPVRAARRRRSGSSTGCSRGRPGVAVPVFALFAAGVPVNGEALGELFTDKIAIGVIAGLVVGKLVGIVGASALAVLVQGSRSGRAGRGRGTSSRSRCSAGSGSRSAC